MRGAKAFDEKRTLFGRIRLVRFAILFALLTALMVIVLMLVLFEQLLSQRESDAAIVTLFAAALCSLVTSLSLFTLDMNRSLFIIRQLMKEAEAEEQETIAA